VIMLVDLVSRGGNLLLDIGPAADGTIPVVMEERLIQIGSWLKVNGEAIYGTRPWKTSRQWSEGEVPKADYDKEFETVYDVTKLTGKQAAGKASTEAFFTSKGPGKGTGLGLSMVYGFVKQSAGHIKIYTEEGHGTTIKMYLPPAAGDLPASEASTEPAIQGGHETILVVEDDKLVRDYVLTQLHSLGYVTLDAANAAQALALVAAGNAFDLLFTDVIIPGTMNGRQLANELQRRNPDVKVLFTSGYTENAIIHHGRLDSGVLLLAKPYRKSDLAIMIRKALGD